MELKLKNILKTFWKSKIFSARSKEFCHKKAYIWTLTFQVGESSFSKAYKRFSNINHSSQLNDWTISTQTKFREIVELTSNTHQMANFREDRQWKGKDERSNGWKGALVWHVLPGRSTNKFCTESVTSALPVLVFGSPRDFVGRMRTHAVMWCFLPEIFVLMDH